MFIQKKLKNVISEMNLQETIRRILREDNYSPAGKEVIPNKIIVHKSNPMFRDDILENGLKVRVGECYQIYVNREQRDPNKIKCKPVIFATNSTKKMDLFDSTYDDDIWEINTGMIPNVKWYIDRHYGSESKHIVTYQDIPRGAITLIYEGTGDSEDLLQESIRRILREESEVPLNVRRRIYILEKLFNVILSNSTPCDYENEEYFIEGILYDIEAYLITFKLEGMTEEEILSFVKEYFYSEMRRYYIDSQEDC
jgi:hypothetical protein